MKKTIISVVTNYRYYVLFIISSLAVLGIFCDVNDNLPLLQWTLNLAISKLVGFACLYATCKLIKVWESENSIPELTALTKLSEDDE